MNTINDHPEYPYPKVDPKWASETETSPDVAAAIHAISSPGRNAEEIWRRPLRKEREKILAALKQYVDKGWNQESPPWRYAAEKITADFQFSRW